jgi:hypothetical protein
MDGNAPEKFVPYGDYQGQEYVASPCCGYMNELTGEVFPKGHTYEIRKKSASFKVVGYKSLRRARADFGTKNLFVSASSTMCLDCLFRMLEEAKEIKRKSAREGR